MRSVKLKKPITLEGKEGGAFVSVDALSFREEIVAGDLRGIKLQAIGDMLTEDLLKIAGRLCGQTDIVMSRLGMADLLDVAEVVGGFLTAGLGTGNEQSRS